jgi:NAD(P)-dependent dehydrogenase (short-subunit alcohol dehydrogenase family)
MDLSVFEETMALNYMGTVNTCKAALPGMVERKQGQVVFVCSVAGIVGRCQPFQMVKSSWPPQSHLLLGGCDPVVLGT